MDRPTGQLSKERTHARTLEKIFTLIKTKRDVMTMTSYQAVDSLFRLCKDALCLEIVTKIKKVEIFRDTGIFWTPSNIYRSSIIKNLFFLSMILIYSIVSIQRSVSRRVSKRMADQKKVNQVHWASSVLRLHCVKYLYDTLKDPGYHSLRFSQEAETLCSPFKHKTI